MEKITIISCLEFVGVYLSSSNTSKANHQHAKKYDIGYLA